eukprot:jgi/Chlat1/2285/Chrsp17S02584
MMPAVRSAITAHRRPAGYGHAAEVKKDLCAAGIGRPADEESTVMVIAAAVESLLIAVNENVQRDGLRRTPVRVARALLVAAQGYSQTAVEVVGDAMFPEDEVDDGQGGGSGGIVLVQNIDFYSLHESDLLPLRGTCHVAYVPDGGRVVGLSKLARIVDVFARRLQTPERLVQQIASAVEAAIAPQGTAVVAEATHLSTDHVGCCTPPPARVACAATGTFLDNSEQWDEFVSLLSTTESLIQPKASCSSQDREPVAELESMMRPFVSKQSHLQPQLPRMMAQVRTILQALGEDPDRPGLLETPRHFVDHLLSSVAGNYCSLVEMAKLRQHRRPDVDMDDCTPSSSLAPSTPDNSSDSESDTQAVTVIELETCIPFCTQCEHHMLPFFGHLHVGYISSSGRQLSRADLQPLVELFARRLQVQERLTRQIAEGVRDLLGSEGGVMVVSEASHMCMLSRGVSKPNSSTTATATLGCFASNPALRTRFLRTLRTKLVR